MDKNYLAEINNLIALCYIIDDFEEFGERLRPLILSNYNRDFIFKLYDISEGKSCTFSKGVKKFYKENKMVIDTISKYSNILRFVSAVFGLYGRVYDNNNLQFFYEYILSYKEHVEQIIEVLEGIKKLGFDSLEFNPNLDFTNELYDVYPSFQKNFHVTYVDNIEVIPSYASRINYRTISSNYKMNLGVVGDNFSEYDRIIIVNSLLFDSQRLPKNITRKVIFDKILKLKDELEEKGISNKELVEMNMRTLDTKPLLTSETLKRGKVRYLKRTD